MRRLGERIVYSPHDLMNFLASEFVVWMDRRALDEQLQKDPDDPGAAILQRLGNEHEAQFLQDLTGKGRRISNLTSDGSAGNVAQALQNTIESMQRGDDVIFQGYLRHEDFAGIPDFLIRVDGDSTFGSWHYEIWDTKLARDIKPEFVIQLCCYAEMLAILQAKLPEHLSIVLGTSERKTIRTADYFHFYKQLKQAFLRHMETLDVTKEPEEIVIPSICNWSTIGKKLLTDRDDLSLVANIRRTQTKKLRQNNVLTMKQLANTEFVIRELKTETFEKLKQQARLQCQTRETNQPHYELLPPSELRAGFKILPPHNDLDIWFDMEGYTLQEPPLEYLFGVTHANGGKPDFRYWLACSLDEEQKAFEDFVDWTFARWEQSARQMHIYHYAPYEVTALKRLSQKYGTREHEIDEFLRNDALVDLYKIVRHAIRVGEPNYSIKSIEHFYRGKRKEDVANAVESLVVFERWLETREQHLLDSIIEYNKVDCDSTMQLTEWLRKLQQDSGIAYEPPKPKEEKEHADKPAGIRGQCADLARVMLAELDTVDPAKRPLHELFAHLLQFHRREEKPAWWQVFEKSGWEQDDLLDDNECLGRLEYMATLAKEGRQRNERFKYRVPLQESKLGLAKRWVFSHDINAKAEVVEFNEELAELTISTAQTQPPAILGLIPKDKIPTDDIETALFEIVSQWRTNGVLRPALASFLERQVPSIQGVNSGEPLLKGEDQVAEQATKIVSNMQNTTLCIQGPPGSGKTTKAAHVIQALIAEGKKVAITSNSHPAIENLLRAVEKRCQKQGTRFSGFKVGGDWEDTASIRAIGKNNEGASAIATGGFDLVGGTAWLFSRPEAVDAFDYLFVDEAGQVSLANFVAVSRCAANIVLLGDQMQLEQPIQGTHPGESGLSLLDYYTRDAATVAPERGIFLPITYRLHPAVCSVISEIVYDGRLHSDSETSTRVLLPAATNRIVTKQAGILFVAAGHEGNNLRSTEEADVIVSIVGELLGSKRIGDGGKEMQITEADILVVAPYNAQVKLLRSRLNNIAVGTVDKFQGQEAPIAILSMCSSDANASPRGLSFLFDKHRLNVALSRAQTLAIVVATPRLANTRCTTVKQMELLNFYCRVVEEGWLP